MENTSTIIINNLTTYMFENENYFIGKEICELLDYKIITTTLSVVSTTNKILFKDFKGEKIPLIDPRTILITKSGIEEILNSNRTKEISSDVFSLLDSYNIRPIYKDRELTEYSYFTKDMLIFEYFVGYEIATLLGYKSPIKTIKNIVSKSNQIYFKDYVGEKIPPLNPKTILITRDGAIEILIKTKKRLTPDIEHILKKFNITTTNKKCLSKEQQCLSVITDVFKTEKFEDQYNVGTYRLDLYFTEYRIVVECDENGHTDRRQCDEKERMVYVNKELKINDSYWIRFNPDEYGFDASRVIGKIHVLMKDKGIYGERKKRVYRKYVHKEDVKKICANCQEEKIFGAFYDREENADGKEMLCKTCYVARQKRAKENKEAKETVIHPEGTKKCKICFEIRDLNFFMEHSTSKDGYGFACTVCTNRIDRTKPEQTEKKCSRCKETKLVAEFSKCSTSVDGRFCYCKQCSKIKSESYRKRKKEKEGIATSTDVDLEKECSDCGTTKLVEGNFWKNQNSCMECNNNKVHTLRKVKRGIQ